ncbi:hypothetical protein Hypma_014266 [Hypsizygus marmoreus]|uniref:Uncharacterized protein n=1 Tax=Hypsizygus marmoreus TaxID=39966 RepID=A0A369JCT8_HYPMA|nr:hypothetical protein Hypma_014266 [Hypsizygus marmoreus]
MTDFAELRLHIQNDHIKAGRMKERIRCKKTTHHSTTAQNLEPIFDFRNTMWLEVAKESALKGLEEEQEFYELLDLDAAEEADDDETVQALKEMINE